MQPDFSALDIRADLQCEIDSSCVKIHSAGRQIIVEVPDVETGLKLLQLGLPRGSRRQRLHTLKRLLDTMALAIEIRVAGLPVLLMGHLTGSGIWRLVGLPVLSFKPVNAISLWSLKNDL